MVFPDHILSSIQKEIKRQASVELGRGDKIPAVE